MAISLRAAGTWADSNATTQTVTLPTHQTGDMLIVRAACKPFSADPVINTSGWRRTVSFADGSVANGNGTGSVRVVKFWKIAASAAETNPVVTWNTTSAPGCAVALSYQKGATEVWETPISSAGGDTTADTSKSMTMAAHIAIAAGDMVDFFYAVRDNAVCTVPTITQTGVTFDTVSEQPAAALTSTTSNDIAADGGYRLATAGTSSAAAVITGTLDTSETGSAVQTRLRVHAEKNYHDEVIADGAEAYFRLNEQSGSTMNDETANNHDGTHQGAPTLAVAGALSGSSDDAITYGTDEYSEATSWSGAVPAAMSMEMWINSNANSQADVGLCGWWDSDSDRAQIYWANNEEIRVGILTTGSTPLVINSGLTALSSAGWHHIVATTDGATMRFYFDGVDLGSLAGTFAGTTFADVFKIGEYGSGLFGTSPVSASFDEVAVYYSELSPAQVLAHFNAADVAEGLQVSPAALALTRDQVAPTRIDQVVSPAVVALAAAAVAPRTDQAIGPAAFALTRDQVTPTRIDQELSPAALARAFVAVSPRVDIDVSPAAAGLTLAPVAPVRFDPAVHPAALALALTAVAPQVDQRVDPGALARTLAILEPTLALSGPQTVSPALIDLLASIFAPNVGGEQSVQPDPAELAIAVVALAQIDQTLAPAAHARSLVGQAPSVEFRVEPPAIAQSLAIVAFTRIDQQLAPAAAARTLTPEAPALGLQVAPGLLTRTLAVEAPTFGRAVHPAAIAQTLIPVAFTRIDQRITPAELALVLVALVPNLGELFPPDAVATFIKQVIAASAMLQSPTPAAEVELS